MLSTTRKGIYLAFFAAFISGVSIFVNKFAVTAITPPLFFTATKNLSVGLIVIGIVVLTAKWKQLKKLSKRDLTYLTLIGIIGGSIPFYLFFTGLAQVSAINAALIQKTLVIWVALLAVPFLKEKLTKIQSLAVFLLFGSNLLVGGFSGFKFSTGEFMILAATLFWAVETIMVKKVLPNVDPVIVTAFRMGLGSLILMVATFITVPGAFTKELMLTNSQVFWLVLTVVALLGYVLSWYRALKHAPAITVSAILVASTLVTNVLSAIFLTHTWNGLLTLQAVVMLGGVALFWVEAKKEKTVVQFN
jgi:drug/metabolite transporter (DMT)-like permease